MLWGAAVTCRWTRFWPEVGRWPKTSSGQQLQQTPPLHSDPQSQPTQVNMRTLTYFRLQHFRTCRVSVICLNVNFFTALSLSAEERAHNETVEGKWEQIQYYESRWNKQHQHQEQSEPGLDPAGGFNSLAR